MTIIRDEMTREELLEFMKETRGRGIWHFTTESGKEGSTKRPIAWMPLPEPYKAGRVKDDKIRGL